MNLSIAICTWNRARLLEDTLRSLEVALAAARSQVEVIVVNNNCTDDTDAVIREMSAALPIRCVLEPRPGLSNARNAAVQAARGRYILWTDDDVIVDPGWITAYETAIDEHPEAAFFGGPIRPSFEGHPPRWLEASLPQIGHIFAAIDLGATGRSIGRVRDLPFGANYAIRGGDQRGICYDPQLGRQPGNYWLAGEESTALGLLLQRGATGWWVPDAGVVHRIPRDRQSLAHLMMHGLGQGSTYQRLRPAAEDRARILGRPISLWRAALKAGAGCLGSAVCDPAEVWVPRLHRACVLAGQLREAHR